VNDDQPEGETRNLFGICESCGEPTNRNTTTDVVKNRLVCDDCRARIKADG